MVFYLIPNGIGHMKLIRKSLDKVGQEKHHDVQVAFWLAENFSPDTSLATYNIGRIPYYSRLETLDLLGLTDIEIAREIRTQKVCAYLNVILSKKPDIILPQSMEIKAQTEKKWWQIFDFDFIGTRQLLDFTKFVRIDKNADLSVCPRTEKKFRNSYEKMFYNHDGRQMVLYIRKPE